MTWIVTGGAGYVGAHVVRGMRDAGLDTVVFDDLSGGRADRLPGDVELVLGSITEPGDVERLFLRRRVEGVIHLAALKSVAESIVKPRRYRSVNVDGLRLLLDAMRISGVRRMIFPSSAAVYGRPTGATVSERSRLEPVSPYGCNKLDGERLIRARDVRSVVFRQFNVIGAGTHPYAADAGTTNLLPAVFRALVAGADPVPVLGDRYDTPDGTAIRDYVHVEDVVRIYLAGIEHLLAGDSREHLVVNVATGAGHSVREVLDAASAAAGRDVPFRIAPPRPGDAPKVVGSAARAAARLDWKAELGFGDAVGSAWKAWNVSG